MCYICIKIYNMWNKLSMKDRAEYIKLGVANGITDLSTIRDVYNKYAEGGGFLNEDDDSFVDPYKKGDTYNTSKECAYFSNHTLNDQGYMMSGHAWTPRGVDVIFNGFEGLDKPGAFNTKEYDKYAEKAVDNVYKNFITKDSLDPNEVYTVNMFYRNSPNKKRAFEEGDNVYGTHTGYLSYDDKDKTWYVTHNINNKIHKDNFMKLQNSKDNIGVTSIYKPRKNTVFNRLKTWIGFANGGFLDKEFM